MASAVVRVSGLSPRDCIEILKKMYRTGLLTRDTFEDLVNQHLLDELEEQQLPQHQ